VKLQVINMMKIPTINLRKNHVRKLLKL